MRMPDKDENPLKPGFAEDRYALLFPWRWLEIYASAKVPIKGQELTQNVNLFFFNWHDFCPLTVKVTLYCSHVLRS